MLWPFGASVHSLRSSGKPAAFFASSSTSSIHSTPSWDERYWKIMRLYSSFANHSGALRHATIDTGCYVPPHLWVKSGPQRRIVVGQHMYGFAALFGRKC